MLASWRDTLMIVEPETVITVSFAHAKWHRKSQRGKSGRPPIDPEIIELIKRMSKDNVTWGAPRGPAGKGFVAPIRSCRSLTRNLNALESVVSR